MNNEKEINESKLKPCPFCGSAREKIRRDDRK